MAEKRGPESLLEDQEVMEVTGPAVEYFHSVDLTNPAVPFLVRQAEPTGPPLLQSHGWLHGRLVRGTVAEAAQRFNAQDSGTWPVVVPDPSHKFVNRKFRPITTKAVKVPLSRLREPLASPPRLSLLFVRWGGKQRIGEDDDPEDEGDGGWGMFGCPPCDWYMAGVVERGVMCHSELRAAGPPLTSNGHNAPPGADVGGGGTDCEVLSLFLGSDSELQGLPQIAPAVYAQLRGVARVVFWMLWPCDWHCDWVSKMFMGYVERRALFSGMRGFEAAGLRSAFPHPAPVYEFITSKAWMATLSGEPEACLPAGVLVSREEVVHSSWTAAEKAIAELQKRRSASPFAAGGGLSEVNRSGGVMKGAVKLGWSWEAKHVWFWHGVQDLAQGLEATVYLDGCLAEHVIVQEWVDFDFELRLFFLPPANWTPPVDGAGEALRPVEYGYTAWSTKSTEKSPGAFSKYSREQCLSRWSNDEQALTVAHAKAEKASQFLIAHLLRYHPEPVPFMRLDFMLRRVGRGQARVVFGEFCEMGACCLSWKEGPPTVWRAALDYALRH